MPSGNERVVGDRTVIVTGAGSGIGRAIALRLLRDGFRCVLAGPVQEQLAATANQAPGPAERVRTVCCDIRVESDVERLVEVATEPPSVLYGLVNNAGVAFSAPLLDEARHEWRDTLATNVEASFFLTQRVLPELRHHGGGRVVNVSSIRGFRAMNNVDYGQRAPVETPGDRGPQRMTAYATSKAAAIQMTRDLAAAVGPWGITVNAVSPGLVQHPSYDDEQLDRARTALGQDPRRAALGDRLAPEIVHLLAARTPLGRVGTVDDIAGPVSFLLSEDAAYVSGANLVVDGGMTVW